MNLLKNDWMLLVSTQNALASLKPMMEKNDDTANTLSDVWNTLLDVRSSILRHIFGNEEFAHTGMLDALKRIVNENTF